MKTRIRFALISLLICATLAGCKSTQNGLEVTATQAPSIAPTIGPNLTFTTVPTVTPNPTAVKMAISSATALAAVEAEPWVDVTDSTIGETSNWTNKVELADINNDGLVDLLFANGGDYDSPGDPEFSQVFLNQGTGQKFKEVTKEVLGETPMLTRVIKVRDVNKDGFPDIMVGTTYQTQSQLYLGDGTGKFTNVTATYLPKINSSIGDLEFGDIDGDSDLDMILADWGPNSPMENEGGRTMLWINDGTGHFSDATATHMPDVLVKFSWELEFVDVDNDYDLDILVSCKKCTGSFLFENDGTGKFTDMTEGRLPQYPNNYDFEAMDLNNDGFLDLVTINDGPEDGEHVFLNTKHGGFDDTTDQLWPASQNPSCDDNMDVFFDYNSDGNADLMVASLSCPDRLLQNNGKGELTLAGKLPGYTGGTLGIAVADLNGDYKIDVVQSQGEADWPEKVYFGKDIQPDTAPPVISLIENASTSSTNKPIQIRARIHDNKSPTMPHDWQSVVLRWTDGAQTQETPMQWYGEYLWRGTIDTPPAGEFSYQICAVDAAGNETCAQS